MMPDQSDSPFQRGVTSEEVTRIVGAAIDRHENRERELSLAIRDEFKSYVAEVRGDLSAIGKQLGEVADLRGDLKSVRELSERLGRESSGLDKRLRTVETAVAVMAPSTQRVNGLVDRVFYAAAAALTTWALSGTPGV